VGELLARMEIHSISVALLCLFDISISPEYEKTWSKNDILDPDVGVSLAPKKSLLTCKIRNKALA